MSTKKNPRYYYLCGRIDQLSDSLADVEHRYDLTFDLVKKEKDENVRKMLMARACQIDRVRLQMTELFNELVDEFNGKYWNLKMDGDPTINYALSAVDMKGMKLKLYDRRKLVATARKSLPDVCRTDILEGLPE